MTIDEQIKELTEKHKVLIEQNPSVREIVWEITDVKYAEFDAWRRNWNKENANDKYESNFVREHGIGDSMFMYLSTWHMGVEKCCITIISKPVKFKHTYEVIEKDSLLTSHK